MMDANGSIYYSQTCIREPSFGKSKLSVIHCCLSYQGSVMKKSFTL